MRATASHCDHSSMGLYEPVFRLALRLTILALLLGATPFSRAGAIVMNDGHVRLGDVTEEGQVLLVKVKYGNVRINLDEVYWYDTDDTVKTYYAAAQKALAAGEPRAAVRLLQISVKKEPQFQNRARRAMAAIREQRLRQSHSAESEPAPDAPTGMSDADRPAVRNSEPSPVSPDELNETFNLRLWDDTSLWNDEPVIVARRLQWPRESRTSYSESYRLYPSPDFRVLGTRPYSLAMYAENGEIGLSSIVFANKGYCVPATWERYLRYMGIQADMYVLAVAAHTGYGGGTSPRAL
ncbi:MAG: hypothetical protein K9N51_04720, partial [Candidatus Pacebacteria bacterium]|nr:hypothetical protein [Candidatus Paceibacterota bacterium]